MILGASLGIHFSWPLVGILGGEIDFIGGCQRENIIVQSFWVANGGVGHSQRENDCGCTRKQDEP